MANIFYSMAGEGRGHATRARTVIEALREQGHTITVFAPEYSYHLLTECYRDSSVTIRRIPGLMFQYSRRKLSYSKSVLGLCRYLWNLPTLIDDIQREMLERRCDLAITDFEPSLPRAAARQEIPWISIDHQHFLVVSDFGELPWSAQLKTSAMRLGVRQYYQGQSETVVSSFYFPPLKPEYEHVRQCGVLLRRSIINAVPQQENHVVVYLRRHASPQIMKALQQLNSPVLLYGLGKNTSVGNVQFRPVTENDFLQDLITCRALISNAGNQLIGEALYLGKAVFAFPEERNLEQQLNAWYLKDSGGGDVMPVRHVSGHILNQFLEKVNEFKCTIPKHRLNGNTVAMEVVNDTVRRTHPETRSQPLPVAA